MHVVHTESVKGLSGQTLRLIAEARFLTRELGQRCTVVGTAGSEFERRARGAVDYVPFPFNRWQYHPLDFWRARRVLRELGPDVVHTHSSQDAWVFGLAARRLGIPIVRGRHVTRPLPRSFFARYVYTHLADAFTTSGEAIRSELLGAGVARPADVFLTPAGVDLARFDRARADRERLRRELGLAPRALVLGCACSLRGGKGIAILLAAFERLLESPRFESTGTARDLHLVLAGAGDPRVFLPLAERARGRVHFLGFRDDVEHVLAGLDLFVLASTRAEGVPAAVLQAMALGVPVVAAAVGGLAEVVRDGETGFLAPPGDATGLAQRIEQVLALEPARGAAVVDAAERLVREGYSLERVCRTYLEAYERVLAAKGGSVAADGRGRHFSA